MPIKIDMKIPNTQKFSKNYHTAIYSHKPLQQDISMRQSLRQPLRQPALNQTLRQPEVNHQLRQPEVNNQLRQPLRQPAVNQPINRNFSTTLNSSMISRIHTAKSGCGCGR